MKVRALLAAVVLTTTMTACGGSDTGGDPPKASATPSPTRSMTGTLLDNVPTAPPERPKDVRSEAGAVAFSAYVGDMIGYTLATSDTLALFNIADRAACRACKQVQAGVVERAGEVQVGSEPFKVTDGELQSEKGRHYTVRQRLHHPDGATIDSKTGKESAKLKQGVLDMTLKIEWRDDAWTLIDYETVKS